MKKNETSKIKTRYRTVVQSKKNQIKSWKRRENISRTKLAFEDAQKNVINVNEIETSLKIFEIS